MFEILTNLTNDVVSFEQQGPNLPNTQVDHIIFSCQHFAICIFKLASIIENNWEHKTNNPWVQ